jgi:putative FmdB family regulatory protein
MMPIYEYQALEPHKGCKKCQRPFEYLQSLNEPQLSRCPVCGGPIKRLISWCRACVTEGSMATRSVEERARDYEREGMWSHAAELLDTHAEKIKDPSLKMRAVDNYVKAGYSLDTIESHLKSDSFMKEEMT